MWLAASWARLLTLCSRADSPCTECGLLQMMDLKRSLLPSPLRPAHEGNYTGEVPYNPLQERFRGKHSSPKGIIMERPPLIPLLCGIDSR